MVDRDSGWPEDVRAEADRLMAANRKIDAIHLVRERTGMGLAEAKAAVESLDEAEFPVPAAPDDEALPSNVLDALRRGRKIEAIKALREARGIGLKEAKDRIDRAEAAGAVSSSGAAVRSRSEGAGLKVLLIAVAAAAAVYLLRAWF